MLLLEVFAASLVLEWVALLYSCVSCNPIIKCSRLGYRANILIVRAK